MYIEFDKSGSMRLMEQVAKQFFQQGTSVPQILDDPVEFAGFLRRVRESDVWLREVAEGDIQECLEAIFRDDSPESARLSDLWTSHSERDQPAVASRNVSKSVSVNE